MIDRKRDLQANHTSRRLFVTFDIDCSKFSHQNVSQLDSTYSMEQSNSNWIVLRIVLDYRDPNAMDSNRSFLLLKISHVRITISV